MTYKEIKFCVSVMNAYWDYCSNKNDISVAPIIPIDLVLRWCDPTYIVKCSGIAWFREINKEYDLKVDFEV